jgi:hypothetical protein
MPPMITNRTLLSALSAALALSATPLLVAPAAAADRVLVIYGNDKCPTSNGEEIVVCSRKPEGERYRIPEELRHTTNRGNENWSDRASSLEYVGRTGIQSCSTSGSGGATGCFKELARKACDEHKDDGKKCGLKF